MSITEGQRKVVITLLIILAVIFAAWGIIDAINKEYMETYNIILIFILPTVLVASSIFIKKGKRGEQSKGN